MSIYVCKGCGHVAFNEAPAKCPVCGAPKSSFERKDNIFVESAEKSKEGAVKHIPSIKVNKVCGLVPENDCIDIIVRIGETLHPMTPEHYIQFIDCYVDHEYRARTYLTPQTNPAVIFHLKNTEGKVQIVESCNLHGLWKAEADL
ncbi:MAG: hypothetical protein JW852_03555 [Spirochaetales bacterium]|nr:hypothetical protein [Spirochaetales bacterium]